VAQRLGPGEGTRLAGEDQERGLEGILGRVPVAEDPPTHAEDHRAVTPQQGCERAFLPIRRESGQQLAVGESLGAGARGDLADVANDGN
jgi:hypothetical protein